MQHLVDEAVTGSRKSKIENQSFDLAHDKQSKIASPSHGYRLIKWCLWEVIEQCPEHRRCKDCLL